MITYHSQLKLFYHGVSLSGENENVSLPFVGCFGMTGLAVDVSARPEPKDNFQTF